MCLEAQGICIKILIAAISPFGFVGNKMDGQQWRAWAVGTAWDEGSILPGGLVRLRASGSSSDVSSTECSPP